jgi:hypothetical protein
MKKLILIFLFIISPSFVFAGNDLTITCNTGADCTKSSDLPLFSETNIYPGYTHSQRFYVDNNRDSACHLKLKAISTSSVPNILSTKISLDITGTNNDYILINYSLTDLLNPSLPPVSLGHVNRNIKNNYLWSVTFDKDAGNEYQNLISNFDINFNFECDQDSTDSSTNTSNNPSSNQGTPECTNSAPDAPTRLIAYRNSDGSVRLNWTETTSSHTGYLIAFGTSPGLYQYGSPDVGNVSTYTVNSLTYGAQYCFYVRSLNGCMPGGRTPEYCVNPGSTITPANIIPTGFQPNILGLNSTQTPEGIVAGSENPNCKNLLFLIILIIAFLINLLSFSLSPKIILPLFLFLINYIIQIKFNPCPFYWPSNYLVFVLPLTIRLLIIKFAKKS